MKCLKSLPAPPPPRIARMRTRRVLAAAVVLLTFMAWYGPARAGEEIRTAQPAPSFTEVNLKGRSTGLSTLAGRPFLLWFTNFSTGSFAAAPQLLELANNQSEHHLALLVVSLNGPYDAKARTFASQYSLEDTVLIDADGSTVAAYTGNYVEGAMPLHNLFMMDARHQVRGIYHFPGVPPRTLELDLLKL